MADIEYIGGKPYKQCTKCLEMKHVSQFPKHPGTSNGLNSRCYKCRSEAKKVKKVEYDWSRARRYREDEPI